MAIALLAAAPAVATTAVQLSDEDLVRSSRAIVLGDVLSLGWQEEDGNLYTYVEIGVREGLAGPFGAGRTIVLKQLGGQAGGVTAAIPGSPRFKAGERALLFLDTWPDGALRVAQLFFGKYDAVRDRKTGRQRLVRRIDGAAVRLIPRQGVMATEAADSESFRRLVRALAARPDVHSEAEARFQGVPLLARPVELEDGASGELGNIAGRYVLLPSNDGRLRRWFQPDRGQAVFFQPNPANAPVADFRTRIDRALSTWTNAPLNNRIVNDVSPSQAATSNLVLQRGADTSAAGLFTDNVNAISYNDPRGQLSDPVNCGGIVAASSYQQGTTESRTIGGRTFSGLLESDVVFNNGWTTSTCGLLLDPVTIEEVTLHEVGHSIGFGHTTITSRIPTQDPIMRPFVFADGRGARMAMDDLSAVTFVYPAPGNPIDEAAYFVGAHYRDFLEREPEFTGWNAWTRVITDCSGCSIPDKRVEVAKGFLFSQELMDVEQSQDPNGQRRLDGSRINTPDYNAAFVDVCYRRYWKTTRPASDTWVTFLNNGLPNSDYTAVVSAFINDNRYRGRFTGCGKPIEQQNCFNAGGTWNSVTCTCPVGCSTTTRQECLNNGGSWNSQTCTCTGGL
jgi:hypothetical protein